ncbi:MAG: ribosomal protein S18-alanine N-acetyltransferase [Microbacterium sp.]|uniref:ribosomal protein S18-alanine N-acetyltransferase n=1 Tax=Microbacterium sp. TaxID=51671 RepID=UPI002828742E|nr:ribosomal protein S18-alanine N-acetyltransferase [Microbacterium sp.]MDR2321184.1 ribosomal protein S18-alanine N-acetyltransferase [Microbacterium sp.]
MIRAATAADLDAIMLIERRSFPTDAWSAELMAAELASPHGRYLVDVEPVDGSTGHGAAEVVVGYGGVRALRGSADGDIQTIALDAAHRGSGRGRTLLRALLAEAAERGAREVFLEVRADNPVAQGLYLSEGFAEIGRRAGYYQPDDVDAVIMRLDLSAWTIQGPVPADAAARDGGTGASSVDDPPGSALPDDGNPADVKGSDD